MEITFKNCGGTNVANKMEQLDRNNKLTIETISHQSNENPDKIWTIIHSSAVTLVVFILCGNPEQIVKPWDVLSKMLYF